MNQAQFTFRPYAYGLVGVNREYISLHNGNGAIVAMDAQTMRPIEVRYYKSHYHFLTFHVAGMSVHTGWTRFGRGAKQVTPNHAAWLLRQDKPISN